MTSEIDVGSEASSIDLRLGRAATAQRLAQWIVDERLVRRSDMEVRSVDSDESGPPGSASFHCARHRRDQSCAGTSTLVDCHGVLSYHCFARRRTLVRRSRSTFEEPLVGAVFSKRQSFDVAAEGVRLPSQLLTAGRCGAAPGFAEPGVKGTGPKLLITTIGIRR